MFVELSNLYGFKMKEARIRKKVVDTLTAEGWICWYPPKVRYKKETDIFGVYDVIAVNKKNSKIKFIQLTTISHIREREKKVKRFLQKHNISIYSEIWGYCKKKKKFKIIIVYD